MELVFIRHAEPQWSVDGLSQSDPALTDRGRRQAALTAERLTADTARPVAELIVSPATRSQETAAPIAEATGCEPVTVDDIVEIQMPDWRGELEETVQRIFAEARHRPSEEWWDGLPGGETFRDFHGRVTTTLQALLAERSVAPVPDRAHLWRVEADPRRIVIVGHGGTNAVAIGWLLGVDPTPWEWERFVLGHASIARLRAVPLAGDHVFSLRSFNDQEHIPPDQRTR